MIDNDDLIRLDERYVKKDDCTDMRSKTDERIDMIHEDVAVVKQKLGTLIGILTTIAVPVVAVAVKYLFGV